MAREAAGGPLSVGRVLQLLKVLGASDGPMGLAELSRQLGAPKTSLIGLLRGLVDLNYVSFTDGAYRLGGSSFELADGIIGARQRLHMGDYIRAGMQDLGKQSDETVLYAILNSDEPTMTYVGIVEGRGSIRISVGIGDRSPLYCTAGGRVLLADMSDDEVRRYLATTPLNRVNPQTETDPNTLFDLVLQARADGFSCVRDEVVQGITGMAAPVRDSSAKVLGALIIAGPTMRVIDREQEFKALTCQVAQGISLSLGYHGGKQPDSR